MRLSFFYFIAIFILGIAIGFSSCRLPSSDLSPEELDIVDTLYTSQVSDFREELDSICQARRDSFIQLKVDSLVDLQLEEIKKLSQRK